MTNSTLTDELTGRGSSVQTDHGGLEFGDLIVLLLDIVLLVYTGWRSYDFLSTTVPDGWQMLALIGLWGLDIGAVAWSLVWVFGSTEKYQDWTAMGLFVIDLIGVILTSVTDSLMYGSPDAMSGTLSKVTTVFVPIVIVGNVIAGFIYHMTSPATKARREDRKKLAEHNSKMREIAVMERDLEYAESYLLARQETLDKATLLAEIKTAQDALEKATRAKLHDQAGIHAAAHGGAGVVGDAVARLKAQLAALRQQAESLGGRGANAASSPAPAPVAESPASSVKVTPALQAAETNSSGAADGGQAQATPPEPTLQPAGEVPGTADPEAVKGNGHASPDPL